MRKSSLIVIPLLLVTLVGCPSRLDEANKLRLEHEKERAKLRKAKAEVEEREVDLIDSYFNATRTDEFAQQYGETGDKRWLDSMAVSMRKELGTSDPYSFEFIHTNLEIAKIEEVIGRKNKAMKQYVAEAQKVEKISRNPKVFRKRFFESVPNEIRNQKKMDDSFNEIVLYLKANCDVLLNKSDLEDIKILNEYKILFIDSIRKREDLFISYEI